MGEVREDRFPWKPGELRQVRTDQEVLDVLAEAKRLAQKYRRLTGKPLGITGEVAEFEAARLLGLRLTVARQEGYDATERVGSETRRIQIKGRVVLPDSKRGQRLGAIQIDKEFDSVLLVLLDEEYDATEIHEAERGAVVEALLRPGSKARNERGALSISEFRAIARLRWARREGRMQPGTSQTKPPR